MTRAIVLHPDDNVATLIDAGSGGASAELTGERGGMIELRADIPYGHKCAVSEIRTGDDVLKYGQVIGRATADIAVGDHVHIHNVEALRARGDR
ncbi:UxaA family hydrolase [Microbaculum sp. FT89]|uniref:UxaA family hydrolase n=1 Tax=Microbaculum sp. FT89 TaxID=3447298 RepID=UPI003F52FA65